MRRIFGVGLMVGVVVCIGALQVIIRILFESDNSSLLDPKSTIGQVAHKRQTKHVVPELYDNERIMEGHVNSAPGTTGEGVPGAIGVLLSEVSKNGEVKTNNNNSRVEAINSLEEKCGWDTERSIFREQDCVESLGFDLEDYFPSLGPDLVDIVIPTTRNNLDFLIPWKEFFQGYHIILVQDGELPGRLQVPEWVKYELYNRKDMKKILGDNIHIISFGDTAIRNFGFLVSKKPYIFTMEETSLPAKDKDGYQINPIAVHLRNLQSPSTPYFFNTLHDPYASDSDFVRGYPYSLRGGVPTAISHGLWESINDYDAPTQLLKPKERSSSKMVDTTTTIPVNIHYSMSGRNVAFARERIGPAMMQGLMGDGQPWGRYGDLFAGWASKAIADHLGFGVKSGNPYLRYNDTSNPFTKLKQEHQGLIWQEKLVRFFANEVSFSSTADTAQKAYLELAEQIAETFGEMNAYFIRLSEVMKTWITLWDDVETGRLEISPVRFARSATVGQYHPLNLGEKSWSTEPWTEHTPPVSVNRDMIFKYFGEKKNESFVSEKDKELGHKWKTYMFPLPRKFHQDVYERYQIAGCLEHACSDERMRHLGFQYVDHQAEIIIFRKLISALNFVPDADDADLILVPTLGVTAIWWFDKNWKIKGKRNRGSPFDYWFKDLEDHLTLLDTDKKHLMLATQDYSMNHEFIRNSAARPNCLVADYGPGKLTVPSLNPLDTLQPSKWKGPLPMKDRDIYLLANFGVRYTDRANAKKELSAYNGTRKILLSNPKGDASSLTGTLHERSIFVLCLAGDRPYTKRIYDAWASVSIPVVVVREYDFGRSYWDTAFNPEDINDPFSPTVEQTYPFVPGLNYSDIVVEYPPEVLAEGRLIESLEQIPDDVIQQKLKTIEKFRELFLYDFEGTSHDAFSNMLENVARWLGVEVD